MIDISIIIVNWNTKKLLIECINSLFDTADKYTIEIIVVDNCSTDGSPAAIRKKFPNITLIVNSANLGFSKANNLGINQSNGRYVCLVNSDIKVLNSCIDTMCAYMDQNPSIGMLGPKTLDGNLSLQPTCRNYPTHWGLFCQACGLDKFIKNTKIFKSSFMTYFDHDSIRSVEALSGHFLMVRREGIDNVGLLDETLFIYGEDLDWCMRFHKAGWKNVFLPNSTVIHYGGASSSAAPIRFILEMLKANFQYWAKYHGKLSRFIFLLIKLYHYFIRVLVLYILPLIKSSDKPKYKLLRKKHIACLKWIFNNKITKAAKH